MALSKFRELFSYVSTSLSIPKASTVSYKSHGLPRTPGSLHGYTFSDLDKKTNLRLSSSLQDLSTYHRIDPEEGGLSHEEERSPTDASPPNLLQKEIGRSSFSKEKVSPRISFGRKKWLQIIWVLLCLLLFTCLSFAIHFLYTKWSRGPSKFYVVLDCGSTGNRVYVYQASVNQKKDDNFPILIKSLPEGFQKKSSFRHGRAYNRMETEPGLDKLVHNISGLRKAIKPLIQWAANHIPRESHKVTSLFVYATAGVRRLPSSDSEWLLNNAWSILKNSPFLCKKEWVKIITGREEAYYGWIALNYDADILGFIRKKETYGALDLGGSSLQVTFEGKKGDHDETSLKLSIGHVKHHLNAYSLAGYGLNDAFDKSVAHLLKNLPRITDAELVSGKIKIKHPCLQSGYKEQYMCSYCESIHLKDVSRSVMRTKSGTGGKTGVSVQLIGVPKWDECTELARVAVNFSEWSDRSPGIDCELQPCALADNLPRPVGQFYAMSGFFVVYQFFNLTPDATLDDVLDMGREFCEKTWNIAQKSVVPQPFIEQYCFRAPYVVLLLREGLHITDRHVILDSGKMTWTLGVALFEAGKAIPTRGKLYGYEILRVTINPFILAAILFASLFVLLCVFSGVGNWWLPKLLRRPCLPRFRHNNATPMSVINIPAPFRFQRWSPINTGDGRVKLPLSPTIANTRQRPFDARLGFSGNGIQFTDSSSCSSSSSVAHSYSSSSLGQMQFDNNNLGSFWTPHGRQMRLQSRRSQSREDLNSSIADTCLVRA